MEIFLEMLQFPFMQRAFIAGALLGLLLSTLGVIATLRKMSFFGEGIAHASLAGIAIAVLAGFAPLPVALCWGVLVASGIYLLERYTKLPSDSLIGIFFTGSMALGVILMQFTSGYQPELLSFLFGSILTVTTTDIWIIAALAIVILVWFFASRRSLTFIALAPESAQVAGIAVHRQLFIFYIALAIATVLGVKLLGIVLISALLILPPATSALLSHSFKTHLILAIIISELSILLGLTLSYYFDLPSGAIIVLVGTVIFFLSLITKKFAQV